MTKCFLFLTALLLFSPCAARAQGFDAVRARSARIQAQIREKAENTAAQHRARGEAWAQIPAPMREQLNRTLSRRRALFSFLNANPGLRARLLDAAFEVPKNFDVSSIANGADVFFIGEYHMNPHMLKEVNGLLGPLARRGFKTLATEFMFTRRQETLDEFYNGNLSETQLMQTLSSDMDPVYLVSLAAGKDKGLRPLALDLAAPPDAPETWAVSDEGMDARNAHWTQTILDYTSRHPDPVVVYCGAAHALYNDQTQAVSLRLQKQGKKVTVLGLIHLGKLSEELLSPADPAVFNPLANLLSEKFKMDKKILVRVPDEYIRDIGSDWLLYLPNLQTMSLKKLQHKVKRAERTAQKTGTSALRCLLDPESGMCLK